MATKSKKSNYSSPMKMTPLSMLIFALVFAAVGYGIRALTHAAPKNSSTSSTSSIKLDQSSPYLGGQVTFTTTYPRLHDNTVKFPRVEVRCYQDVNGNGTITTTGPTDPDFVYAEAMSADQATNIQVNGQAGITLGGSSSKWLTRGGAATCNSDLYYFSTGGQYIVLAATSNWQAAGAR